MTEVFGTVDNDTREIAGMEGDGEPRRRHLVDAEPEQDKTAVERSLFDELAEEAERELGKFVHYENTLRPGYYMRFSAEIDAKELKRYENHTLGTGKRRRPEDADLIKGNAVMLGEKCVAILKGGIEDKHIIADPNDGGEDLIFRSESFVKLFGDGDGRVQTALQKFLGDAQIMKIAGALLEEAGYTDEAQAVDPTIA
ncbi:tail assembly chaperone [Arthrobacter phage Jawnski]|uniref:Uncharacterized protein n=1 Tax=Arthrobacter phage Jawnski TaxID=1772327 RepID=A0A0U4JYT5_9CAUD|nr:tail assembly chaperone [Arthrobacter phage Jawnski]ALY09346.1 hypothetical protein JAWNSKI_16 [Arthrobacter phage Jawnski]